MTKNVGLVASAAARVEHNAEVAKNWARAALHSDAEPVACAEMIREQARAMTFWANEMEKAGPSDA